MTHGTFQAKPADAIDARRWFVVDAAGEPLGRLASKIATVLSGKHKPTYTTHVDTGDFVVVVNAGKIKLTGNKLDQKHYFHHSGIPGGFKKESYRHLIERKPEFPLEKAVKGMLPKSVLGRQMLQKLKVYATADHPHTAQKPEPLKLETSMAPTDNRTYATGKRKTAVARVWLFAGSGKMTVNGVDAPKYFVRETNQMIARQSLELLEVLDQFDVMATVLGGGHSAQAEAVRHGIARALITSDPERRPPLKRAGFLTRDARKKERKKPGQPGARKRFQYSKR